MVRVIYRYYQSTIMCGFQAFAEFRESTVLISNLILITHILICELVFESIVKVTLILFMCQDFLKFYYSRDLSNFIV